MAEDNSNHDAIIAFYRKALSVNAETTSTAVLEQVLAAGFRSVNSQGVKDKATLIAQVAGFWKLIPNLKWEPQDKIVAGNKVVVRSIASGNPVGNFMGMSVDGTKAFKIDTIDIHTIENGQIVEAYHLEDWATAMGQLKN